MSGTSSSPAVVRGRFAPSPTGPLHFGSLVAALASYCDARQRGGEWLVRIEDVDTPRSRPGAEQAILAALDACGFVIDGPVVRQRERTPLYDDALATLTHAGLVYACGCTRRDLESAPVTAIGEHVYPGTCRHLPPDVAATGPFALRVRVDDATIGFTDRVQGPQAQDLARDLGDFVIRRSDKLHAYQLAVVVDDAAQGINSIVRGADLLASTPRQIFLQRALHAITPEYLHVPVAVDENGHKLSKQTLARALDAHDPLPALRAAWRFLGQPDADAAHANAREFVAFAVRAWSAAAVPRVPAALAPQV